MILLVVAVFAQLEAQLLAVFRMLQVVAEIAHLGVRLLVDADEVHLPRHPLAADLKAEHGRHDDRWRHAGDRVAGDAADLVHVPIRIVKAVHPVAFDHQVREDAVNAVLHLTVEAGHHAVDHDHRGHAERNADDRRQGDVTRAQIPPAEQKFVHRPILGKERAGRTACR